MKKRPHDPFAKIKVKRPARRADLERLLRVYHPGEASLKYLSQFPITTQYNALCLLRLVALNNAAKSKHAKKAPPH